MTRKYNRYSEKDKRRHLRENMPKAEVLLWTKLTGRQLLGYKFRRQYSIGPYIVDFHCAELKLAIELDGDSHFAEGGQGYDEKRDEYLESFGIQVLRFLHTDVYDNIEGVLEVTARQVQMRPRSARKPSSRVQGESRTRKRAPSETPPTPPCQGGEQ